MIDIYFEVQQTIRKGDIILITKSRILHVAIESQKDKRTFVITINYNFFNSPKKNQDQVVARIYPP